MRVIAIDGPSGSGKSTVAQGVATRLEMPYLDSGAMYRAIAFATLRDGIPPIDKDAIAELATRTRIEVGRIVTVDGEDVTAAIRGAEVTELVSLVAAIPEVRQELVAQQRDWVARRGGAVVEGRDIGTVVFPEAEIKVYLTAREEVRAERRRREGGDAVAAAVALRDRIDSTRAHSPLKPAEDATVIDTSDLSTDAVIDEVLGLL